jgi:hypothetical protein
VNERRSVKALASPQGLRYTMFMLLQELANPIAELKAGIYDTWRRL